MQYNCEMAKASDDAHFKSEAESLANQLIGFKFLVCLCFYFDTSTFPCEFPQQSFKIKTLILMTD